MSERFELKGARIREQREAAGFTIDELAERIGIEPHVLSGYENGHRTIALKDAGPLEVALRRELLGMDPPRKIPGAARPPVPGGAA